ncbi:hypothetical protein ACFPRL_04955 [Pseudoclavibacter helvolus]
MGVSSSNLRVPVVGRHPGTGRIARGFKLGHCGVDLPDDGGFGSRNCRRRGFPRVSCPRRVVG